MTQLKKISSFLMRVLQRIKNNAQKIRLWKGADREEKDKE